MFENFSIWLKHDPTAKNKVIFFVGLLVFLPVFFGAIWWLNFGRTASKPQSSSSSLSSIRPQITDKTFENSSQLELFDPQILGNVDSVYFLNGQVFSFNQSQNLKVDGQVLPQSPSFLPTSLYTSAGSIIINEETQTTLFQQDQFTVLEKGVGQVVPLSGDFYYLFGSGNTKSLRKAKNINLNQGIASLASFSLPDINSWAEIRVFKNQIYVLIYEKSSKQGQVILQKLSELPSGNSLQTVKVWTSVESINFGDKIVITNSQSGQNGYQTSIFDPSDSYEVILQNEKLRKLDILGNFWASRCNFGTADLFCLVKQSQVSTIIANEPDKLIKINSKGEFEIVFGSFVFSASDVFVNSGGEIFIVNPLKDLLYRLKT